ncbi:MAG: NADH-quinone oxidoreductase subunit A [Chloroflexi bacterium]|nr:NADH-quinone oxidoreductase subunit A [Chloroflexota bacterium]
MLVIPLVLARIGVAPRKPSMVKTSTYECGPETVGRAWVQFNFRYYLFGLLFVLFDIEAVFLYPWAVAYGKLKLFGLIEMLIFILILVVGYIYAWKKKALEWK